MNGLEFQQLPTQQNQETDVFSLLDEQHKFNLQKIDNDYAVEQNAITQSTQNHLKVLQQKFKIEENSIYGLNLDPDETQKRLNQLNTKYYLAITTARGKITPNIDLLNNQRAQTVRNLEQDRAVKQIRLKQIQASFDKGDIVDPAAALKEQYEVLGYTYPISAFRTKTASPEDQIKEIDTAIGNIEEELRHYTKKDIEWLGRGKELVRYPEATATGLIGEPRYATKEEKETHKELKLILADLLRTRSNLMAETYPEYAAAYKKANKLTSVGLQMSAGRKPGTLGEGIWQQKQRKLKSDVKKLGAFGLPGMMVSGLLGKQVEKLGKIQAKRQTKTTTKPTKYATNPTTGQTLVSYDNGQSWETLSQ